MLEITVFVICASIAGTILLASCCVVFVWTLVAIDWVAKRIRKGGS